MPEQAIDFGMMETMVTHLARCQWVLRLDGDETLENAHLLFDLIDQDYDAWKFPRKRWADLKKSIRLENEAWPDFQFRFFLNDKQSRYIGIVHPHFDTPHVIGETYDIWLNHFVDPLHLSDPVRAEERRKLREILAKKSGKTPEGSSEAMRLAGLKS